MHTQITALGSPPGKDGPIPGARGRHRGLHEFSPYGKPDSKEPIKDSHFKVPYSKYRRAKDSHFKGPTPSIGGRCIGVNRAAP
jgi:hypothetical protein